MSVGCSGGVCRLLHLLPPLIIILFLLLLLLLQRRNVCHSLRLSKHMREVSQYDTHRLQHGWGARGWEVTYGDCGGRGRWQRSGGEGGGARAIACAERRGFDVFV